MTVRLLRGEQLTNNDVMRICGYVTTGAAYKLMMQLAALHEDIAITFASGVWYALDE